MRLVDKLLSQKPQKLQLFQILTQNTNTQGTFLLCRNPFDEEPRVNKPASVLSNWCFCNSELLRAYSEALKKIDVEDTASTRSSACPSVLVLLQFASFSVLQRLPPFLWANSSPSTLDFVWKPMLPNIWAFSPIL